MNALLRPIERTLLQQQLDNVRHYGAPGAHLEAPEVPQWVRELDGVPIDMAFQMAEAFSDLEDKPRDRLNRLLEKCMGDITADDMIELRDALRSCVLDYSIAQMQRMIDRELELS